MVRNTKRLFNDPVSASNVIVLHEKVRMCEVDEENARRK
jgi:hypothetical protein